MKILYIWDSDYPWDIRVEKICKSLSKKGIEVHIASRNIKRRIEFEIIDGIRIHRLKCFKNKRLNYALSFPAFFNPFWKKFINQIIKNNCIDLLIVRDLPLSITAIKSGKKNGVPVIMDMAEDYVALIEGIWRSRKFEGLNLLIRNPYLARIVEKYVFKKIDHFIIVIKEAAKILRKRGRKDQDITIIENTPSFNMFETPEKKPTHLAENIKGKYIAIYTGGIQMGRGLQVVFKAIPNIIKKIPNFMFVILGEGYAKDQLQALANNMNICKYIYWAGWIEHVELYNYIKASDIGLIPHYRNKHKDTTIPNKLFDYMGCKLPVISSDAIPIKRILEEEKCGFVFESGNSEDLAEKVIKTYNSDINHGENGRQAILKRYNWQNEEQKLFNLIDKFK